MTRQVVYPAKNSVDANETGAFPMGVEPNNG